MFNDDFEIKSEYFRIFYVFLLIPQIYIFSECVYRICVICMDANSRPLRGYLHDSAVQRRDFGHRVSDEMRDRMSNVLLFSITALFS